MSEKKPFVELYSIVICPYVQRVRIALLDKKISHKVHIIDITKPRPDWFLKLNPLGKCPVLVHDGNVIVDSGLILKYIEDITGKSTLPVDPYQRYLSRALSAYADSDFFPSFFSLLTNQDRSKDQELIDKRLKVYRELNSKLLQTNPEGTYAFGDSLSLPDYTYASILLREVANKHYRNFEIPDTEEYKRVLKWKNGITSLDIVRNTCFDDETIIKMLLDYSNGYTGGKAPPGKESVFTMFSDSKDYEIIF